MKLMTALLKKIFKSRSLSNVRAVLPTVANLQRCSAPPVSSSIWSQLTSAVRNVSQGSGNSIRWFTRNQILLLRAMDINMQARLDHSHTVLLEKEVYQIGLRGPTTQRLANQINTFSSWQIDLFQYIVLKQSKVLERHVS